MYSSGHNNYKLLILLITGYDKNIIQQHPNTLVWTMG